MSGRMRSQSSLLAALSVLASLTLFTSCASSTPDSSANPPLDSPSADAALLDDSTKPNGATDVSDSAAFADLENLKDKKSEVPAVGATAVTESPGEEAAAAPANPGDTFYNSMGGETIRRVALTLYSDKSFTKKLLEKNPELKGVKKLSAEQKVFFDMDTAKPEPRFLTKDLIQRYTQPLAERIASANAEKGLTKTTVTVNKGESLQDVSQRLYGSVRYWPEIFLANHDKIQNYDKVKAGVELSVYNHPGKVASAEPETKPVRKAVVARTEDAPKPKKQIKKTEAKKEKPVPAVAPVAALPIQVQPEPVAPPPPPKPVAIQPRPIEPPPPPKVEPAPTPITPVAMDPIPETKPLPPPVVEKITPTPIAEAPKPAPTAVAEQESSNSNFRRILYIVLITAIGGGAFYFTRTPKKPKVDMLDLNAEAGSRPKLAAKDSQKTNIS